MLRRAVLVLLAVVATAVANVARAQDDDYSRTGCYLGLSAGYQHFLGVKHVVQDASMMGGANVDEDTAGLHARGGCRGRWGGGELHFEWFDDFSVGPLGDAGGWAIGLDGKIYFLAGLEGGLPPVARRFQPFATLGFGYLALDVFDDEWDFAFRLGGGLDAYITRNIAVTTDVTWVTPISDSLCDGQFDCANDDLDYLSVGLGLIYRF